MVWWYISGVADNNSRHRIFVQFCCILYMKLNNHHNRYDSVGQQKVRKGVEGHTQAAKIKSDRHGTK